MNKFVLNLICLIDGKRSIEEIIHIYYKNADEEESKYNVEEILSYLLDNDFLTFDIVEGKIAALQQKRPNLDFVNMRITNNCNFKCIHCFPNSNTGRDNNLEINEIYNILDKLAQYKVIHITITGGEPFLNKHIIDIVKYANEKGMIVSICTNASLITDKQIEELTNCSIGALKVSLDGATAETHDMYRGQGKFNQVITNIEKISSTNIPVCINTVFSKINFNQYILMGNLVQKLGAKEFAYDYIRKTGRAIDNWNRLELSREQKLELVNYYDSFNGKMGKTIIGSKIFSDLMVDVMEEDKLKLACGTCLNNLVILSNGDVVPCWRLHDLNLSAGNLREEKLDDIWNSSDLLKKIRSLKLDEIEKCCNCENNVMCDASCRAFALQFHKDWNGLPDAERCSLYRMRLKTR